MTPPAAQTLLASLAMVLIGALAAALVFHAVPRGNEQLVTFALGALSGALTVGGAGKSREPTPPSNPKEPSP
jgi:hypothetical protein